MDLKTITAKELANEMEIGVYTALKLLRESGAKCIRKKPYTTLRKDIECYLAITLDK